MRRRCLLITGCLAVLATTTFSGCSAASSNHSTPPARLVTITIPTQGDVASQWLNYPAPARANVLLPAGYNPHNHYPLVIFLHGFSINYDWYAKHGYTKPFNRLGAIVVMPEGASGWYADWWNDGARGNPAWESYELDVVLPTILARYPILPQRRYHALIGNSMGGLGAAYLGGRLPGFFGSVAILSGFVDPQYKGVSSAMGVASNAAANGDHNPNPVYGPPDGFYADGHNPVLLARNLKHTRIFMSTGTGTPSKASPSPPVPSNVLVERDLIYPMSELYHEALVAAGVDVTYQVHAGVHSTPDFLNEVKAMLGWGLFKPVTTQPTSWINDTVATRGHLWDIGYHFARPPNQVVQFQRSGRTLSISAAGSEVAITTTGGCTIRTPTPTTIGIPTHRCTR